MKAHQKTIGQNDEWLTPPKMLDALGSFDLDPCSPINRPWWTAKVCLTILDDGLKSDWQGRVWLNPPFNRYERPVWMRKMADHGNGIMMIPAATETKAFDDFVWKRADAVCFVKGRPHFHFVDGKRASFNCGTAIALVAYGSENTKILAASELGRTILLNARAMTPAKDQANEK